MSIFNSLTLILHLFSSLFSVFFRFGDDVWLVFRGLRFEQQQQQHWKNAGVCWLMERFGNDFKKVNLDNVLGPIVQSNILKNKSFLLTCTIPIKATTNGTHNERQVCSILQVQNAITIQKYRRSLTEILPCFWLIVLCFCLCPWKISLKWRIHEATDLIWTIRAPHFRQYHSSKTIWSNKLKRPAVLCTVISKMFQLTNIVHAFYWRHSHASP